LIGTDKNPFYANAKKALEMFSQIIKAIGTYNHINIVHRDLSPGNILVLPNESIKIIDFGLVQITSNEHPITLTDVDEGVGTIYYMAPECEAGAIEQINVTADLYSAGKILWAAITNLNAFGREKPVFTHRSLPICLPDVPATWHLQHIFEKTIRANPKDRWNNPYDAINMIGKVSFLIDNRYQPIEKVNDAICPVCGFGTLRGFERSHNIFGNPNPPGFEAVRCDYCGYCSVVDTNIIRANYEKRETLS
jgi:serine/threonine protein kinase